MASLSIAASAAHATPDDEDLPCECDLSHKGLNTEKLGSFFEVFRTVESVNLAHNCIDRIDYIPQSLVILDISNNKLASLAGVEVLHNLRQLDVSYNFLESILPVQHCTRLTSLRASHNWLPNLAGVPALHALRILDASYNAITDFGQLRPLSLNKRLESLRVEGNPVAEGKSFRHAVTHLLPTLVLLDGYRQARSFHPRSPHQSKRPSMSYAVIHRRSRSLRPDALSRLGIDPSHAQPVQGTTHGTLDAEHARSQRRMEEAHRARVAREAEGDVRAVYGDLPKDTIHPYPDEPTPRVEYERQRREADMRLPARVRRPVARGSVDILRRDVAREEAAMANRAGTRGDTRAFGTSRPAQRPASAGLRTPHVRPIHVRPDELLAALPLPAEQGAPVSATAAVTPQRGSSSVSPRPSPSPDRHAEAYRNAVLSTQRAASSRQQQQQHRARHVARVRGAGGHHGQSSANAQQQQEQQHKLAARKQKHPGAAGMRGRGGLSRGGAHEGQSAGRNDSADERKDGAGSESEDGDAANAPAAQTVLSAAEEAEAAAARDAHFADVVRAAAEARAAALRDGKRFPTSPIAIPPTGSSAAQARGAAGSAAPPLSVGGSLHAEDLVMSGHRRGMPGGARDTGDARLALRSSLHRHYAGRALDGQNSLAAAESPATLRRRGALPLQGQSPSQLHAGRAGATADLSAYQQHAVKAYTRVIAQRRAVKAALGASGDDVAAIVAAATGEGSGPGSAAGASSAGGASSRGTAASTRGRSGRGRRGRGGGGARGRGGARSRGASGADSAAGADAGTAEAGDGAPASSQHLDHFNGPVEAGDSPTGTHSASAIFGSLAPTVSRYSHAQSVLSAGQRAAQQRAYAAQLAGLQKVSDAEAIAAAFAHHTAVPGTAQRAAARRAHEAGAYSDALRRERDAMLTRVHAQRLHRALVPTPAGAAAARSGSWRPVESMHASLDRERARAEAARASAERAEAERAVAEARAEAAAAREAEAVAAAEEAEAKAARDAAHRGALANHPVAIDGALEAVASDPALLEMLLREVGPWEGRGDAPESEAGGHDESGRSSPAGDRARSGGEVEEEPRPVAPSPSPTTPARSLAGAMGEQADAGQRWADPVSSGPGQALDQQSIGGVSVADSTSTNGGGVLAARLGPVLEAMIAQKRTSLAALHRQQPSGAATRA